MIMIDCDDYGYLNTPKIEKTKTSSSSSSHKKDEGKKSKTVSRTAPSSSKTEPIDNVVTPKPKSNDDNNDQIFRGFY